MLLTIQETDTENVVHQEIIVGEDVDVVDLRKRKHKIDFSKLNSTSIDFTVSLRKLTTAEPFAPGIATWFFKPSTFEFFGVETISTLLNDPPKEAVHRI